MIAVTPESPSASWSPTGKARGTSIKYPPTPLGAEALRCASAKASEGYPPSAKSAEAAILQLMIYPGSSKEHRYDVIERAFDLNIYHWP